MSIKILLADDSITIQKVIGIIFGGEEYSLTVVDNGKAAVDRANDVSPDVLLIDALMPGMTGYEVCEAIRANPALAQKPILLLTGSFEPFDESRAKNCGADDFLAKPFESQQIVTKVKELYSLGVSRAGAAPQPEPQPFAPSAVTPESAIPPETAPGVSTDDIWGAFTPVAEPAAVSDADQPIAPEAAFEPGVLSFVGDQPEAVTVPPEQSPSATEPSWSPVEEHTFEFEETTVAAPIEPPDQEDAFGEISFGDELTPLAPEPPAEAPAPDAFAEPAPLFAEPSVPAFEEPVAQPFTVEPAPSQPLAAATAEAAAPPLTEEQLRAALAAVSRDVIERIVWEVVPDLAETLIKDAIRKIKEGV